MATPLIDPALYYDSAGRLKPGTRYVMMGVNNEHAVNVEHLHGYKKDTKMHRPHYGKGRPIDGAKPLHIYTR